MREVCDARSAIGYHIFQHALDSWGNGWVHDFGLTRENYHVTYVHTGRDYQVTLNTSNRIGFGDFVVENGILYGPPNSQGIPVPKKLRDLIRTDNLREYKQSKKSIRRHDAPTTCEEIAKADKVLREKKQRNKVEKKRKRDYKRRAKVFEMSEEEFQKELSKMSKRSRLEFVK
jgi:hypothetical protein